MVADYFDMLQKELLAVSFSKIEYRSRLKPRLQGRSDGSIEFKHQNISAVLVKRELPYIDGYEPRANYQTLLADEVEAYLHAHSGYFDAIAEGERLNPRTVPVPTDVAVEQLFVSPPEQMIVPILATRPRLSRRGRKIDFARRDAENRWLTSVFRPHYTRV